MLIKTLIGHFFTAGNEHNLHSPFLFQFYNNIVKSTEMPLEVHQIELLRKTLQKDNRVIEITDFGAGSRWNKSNSRKISMIAKTSEKALKWQGLFYRLIKHYFHDSTILELGTSLGLTTSYLAFANLTNQVTSFEGCPQIARVAEENFQDLKIPNISQIIGNIDQTLPEFLKRNNRVDLVFFDANHRYEPTIRYFELCLAQAHEDSIFIFDDIYWSVEMRKAWEEIKQHKAVRQTLDFWQIGIVMFRETQPVQHFKLKA